MSAILSQRFAACIVDALHQLEGRTVSALGLAGQIVQIFVQTALNEKAPVATSFDQRS